MAAEMTNLSGLTLEGVTGTGIISAGTSSATAVTDDTAGVKFISAYFDNGATSGDARGIYDRLYLTGAGGGGEALRVFTTVQDVAASTAHGAHISLNFGSTGTVTGQGIASRNTLHLPDVALTSNVTMSAVQAEIYSDGDDSDPGGSTILSFFRVVNGGNANGRADVDDDAALFDLAGFTAGSGNMIGANTAGSTTLDFANWVPVRVLVEGVVHYMVAAQTIAATGA